MEGTVHQVGRDTQSSPRNTRPARPRSSEAPRAARPTGQIEWRSRGRGGRVAGAEVPLHEEKPSWRPVCSSVSICNPAEPHA